MKFNKLFKKQLGFTLIEIIIVLAIVGTAIAGVLYYQSKADKSQKVNEAIQAITAMVTSVQAVYGPVGTYNDVNVAAMISGGMIHSPFVVTSASSISDPWGHTISDGDWSVIGYKGGFVLRIVHVSKEDCIALATGLASIALNISVGTITGVDWGSPVGTPAGGKVYKADATAKPDPTALFDKTDGCAMDDAGYRVVGIAF